LVILVWRHVFSIFWNIPYCIKIPEHEFTIFELKNHIKIPVLFRPPVFEDDIRIVNKCESIVKRRKRMTNDAVRMRMTLWKKNSSNYTAPFANAMIADL